MSLRKSWTPTTDRSGGRLKELEIKEDRRDTGVPDVRQRGTEGDVGERERWHIVKVLICC